MGATCSAPPTPTPPCPVRDAVLGGFADSLSDTIAMPIAVLGFLGVLRLPELPLRTSVRNDEPVTDGERFGAVLETSFVDDDADAPDLTAGGSRGRQTDATSSS